MSQTKLSGAQAFPVAAAQEAATTTYAPLYLLTAYDLWRIYFTIGRERSEGRC